MVRSLSTSPLIIAKESAPRVCKLFNPFKLFKPFDRFAVFIFVGGASSFPQRHASHTDRGSSGVGSPAPAPTPHSAVDGQGDEG